MSIGSFYLLDGDSPKKQCLSFTRCLESNKSLPPFNPIMKPAFNYLAGPLDGIESDTVSNGTLYVPTPFND